MIGIYIYLYYIYIIYIYGIRYPVYPTKLLLVVEINEHVMSEIGGLMEEFIGANGMIM
jgi:hypothetical protein